MGKCAFRIIVLGRVTGVGFRYSTVREAAGHASITGYVRNADSRTVECVIQGSKPDVWAMRQWITHGPASARVTKCEATPIPVNPDLNSFDVRFC